MPDPFSETYDAIWTLLEAHTGFTDLVRAGNLEPVGTVEWHWANTSLRLTQLYQLTVSSGDLRVDLGLFPLKWAIIKAFAKDRANPAIDTGTALNLRLLGFDDSRVDEELNREGVEL